jgi:hypothetical protein
MLLALHEARMLVRVTRAGTYRLAVHWSPYWQASAGCLFHTRGMLRLRTRGSAKVSIVFDVDATSLLNAFARAGPTCAGR